MRAFLLAVLVLCVVSLIGALTAYDAYGASCHVHGSGAFTTPDNRCTPGAVEHLSKTEVCTSKDRPSLSAADRRRILSNYGVPGWTGANGELDHREPFFLGGLTTPANLWPERGSIPNLKDRLENYVRRRICTGEPSPMTVRFARIVFAGNWVAYYRFYFAGGPRPTDVFG